MRDPTDPSSVPPTDWPGRPADATTADASDPGGWPPYVPPPRTAVSLPGYDIEAELGHGGMGVVYLARQKGLNRTVALKMIRGAGVAGAEELARFRAEAEALARLRHPHIVPVYEVGDGPDGPFFAMEHVGGGTLARRLGHAPQPPRDAAAIAETLARAMQAAHEANIVHRDLKPANVLLAADGSPKITDFGLAKRLEADSGQTRTGQVMGTPSYMAPEQAAGSKDIGPAADVWALGAILYEMLIGPAADVWALGAILYEMLTGRPPFSAPSVLETLEQVRTAEPVPPGRLQAKVPRDLETITLKCLQKEPSRRYGSAQALADDLRRFLDGRPIVARPVGAVERAGKWMRRNPALAALLVTAPLLALATAGGLVALGYSGRLAAALDETEEQRQLAVSGRAEAERLKGAADASAALARAERKRADDNRLLAEDQRERAEGFQYTADMNLAHVAWQDNQLRQARDLLRAYVPKAGQPDRRGFEWYYLWRLTNAERFVRDGLGTTRLAVRFATADRLHVVEPGRVGMIIRDHLRTYDLTGGAAAPKVVPLPSVRTTAVSGNGRRVAVLGEKLGSRTDWQVTVLDAADGRRLAELTLVGTSKLLGLALSDDGARLATTAAEGVQIWDAATGKAARLIKLDQPGTPLGFSSDGARVATMTEKSLAVWNLASGARVAECPLAVGAVPLAVNLRHGLAACRVANGGLVLTDLKTGRPARTLLGMRVAAPAIRVAAFSPDGTRVAAAGEGMSVRVWSIATGRTQLVFRGHEGAVVSLTFGPGGRLLASAGEDDAVRVWDTRHDPEFLSLPRGVGVSSRVAFLAGGRRLLATATTDGVRITDPAEGREVASVPARDTRPAFSPDGLRLVTAAGGDLDVWDTLTGAKVATVQEPQGPGWVARAFRPDNRQLASYASHLAGGVPRGVTRVWSLPTGQLLRTFTAAASGRPIYSPDGQALALYEYERVRVVSAEGGEELGALKLPRVVVKDAAFRPDGRQLALACGDGAVRLLDAATLKELRQFKGHAGEVFAVAFTPDGGRLASLGRDETLRVWDLKTGQQALRLYHPGIVEPHQFAFSPDGRWLVACNITAARVYDATPRTAANTALGVRPY